MDLNLPLGRRENWVYQVLSEPNLLWAGTDVFLQVAGRKALTSSPPWKPPLLRLRKSRRPCLCLGRQKVR